MLLCAFGPKFRLRVSGITETEDSIGKSNLLTYFNLNPYRGWRSKTVKNNRLGKVEKLDME